MTGLWHRLKQILIVLILIWGALALLARLATPLLETQRQPLADWLGEQIGAPVSIGRLQASWYGIGPRVRLQQLRIGSGEQAIELQQAAIDIAPTGLLGDEPLDALRLTLDGLDLHLVREANGQIHVRGLALGTQTGESGGALRLPSRLRLHNTRLHWQDKRAGGEPLVLDPLYLDLRRDGERLRLRASLRSPHGSARFAADIDGLLRGTDWSGSSYLRVDDLALAPLLRSYLPPHYRIDSGQLELQLWQNWRDARPLDARGQLTLNALQLGNTDARPHTTELEQLRSDFQFARRTPDEWTLQLDGLQLQAIGHAPWPASRVVLHRHLDAGQRPWVDAAAELIHIGPLADLLQIRAPTPELADALAGLQPDAELRRLRLRLPIDDYGDWAFSADFAQLQLQPWQGVPGVQGLAGHIAAEAQHASITLDGRDLPLDATGLLRAPLQLSRLQGTLHWLSEGDDWRLLGDQLQLYTPHFRTRSRLQVRQDAGQPLHMDLITELRDGEVAATSQYLPASIMGEELVQWLDRSLTAGHIEQAQVLLSGPLDDFPFDKRRSGAFEVVLTTRDTPLAYQVGWPPLKDVSARLEFHQNSLDIHLLEGRIYDSQITQAHAQIRSLDPTSSLLMKGELRGPLKDEIALLGEPALSDDFGHIAQALKVHGDAALALDFEVPLVQGRGDYQLDGTLRFIDARMALPEWDLSIDRINGELGISLDALQARNIQGFGLGAPLSVDVTPLGDGSTRISARGHLSREAIAKQVPQLPLQAVSGSADFVVELDIPGLSQPRGTPTLLSVSSDLKGMQVELPAPLGKSSGQTRALKVELPVAGEPQPTRISYDDKLSAAFSPDWTRGEVRFNRGDAQVPDAAGFRLNASFAEFDVAAWQAAAAALGAEGGERNWHADISSDLLRIGELQVPRIALAVQGNAEAIEGGVLSQKFTGRFRYPRAAGEPITVHLAKAHLEFDSDSDSESGLQAPQPAGTDPRTLPPLQLECNDLWINGADFGKLRLLAVPAEHGLVFQELSLDGPSGRIQAAGNWLMRGEQPHTDLQASIQSPDFGEVLAGLGFARHMHDAPLHAELALDWPGHPGQLHRASLAGNVLVEIGAGRLAQVDPGVARVLGLLSLDALTRRIKLDFGDLLKKGYSFDRIEGSFRIEEGQAYTNDLQVNGPSGRIEIGGRIGLVDRDFDQLVNVTPDLDATLPLASTLAGGPVAGLATLLAQQLMSEEVDEINRFEYSVTGSWDEPVLTPLESGGALSRIVNKVTGKKTGAKTEAQEQLVPEAAPRKKGVFGRLLDALPRPSGDDDELLPELH